MAKLTDKQREKIEDGKWIHASMVVEVQGNDKEHVKGALNKHIEKIKKERDAEVYDVSISEPADIGTNLYSLFADIKFIAKDFNALVHLALLYSPSSVEVFEPKQIAFPIGDAQNILTDISNIVTSLAHTIFIQEGQLMKYRAAEQQLKSEK